MVIKIYEKPREVHHTPPPRLVGVWNSTVEDEVGSAAKGQKDNVKGG